MSDSSEQRQKMITKRDIYDFFNNECEASLESISKLYALDISERVKKRKAVEYVRIDPDFDEFKDGFTLRKASAPVNISDFKVGEYLVIHDSNPMYPTGKCMLYDYTEEGDMLLGFDRYGRLWDIEEKLKDNPSYEFMLDKAPVNLKNIYDKGAVSIREESMKLINEVPAPTFSGNREEIENEIDRIVGEYQLRLTAKQREAIANALLAEDYYLIQGPPGTGKSFVVVFILTTLLMKHRERVMVSGPNHLAINSVLSKQLAGCDNHRELLGKVGQSFNTAGLDYTDTDGNVRYIENFEYLDVLSYNEYDCSENGVGIGCSPFHLFTRRAEGVICDTLIIDEAGQMNIGLALMAMSCAKKVIFVGDHKQMAPIFASEDIKDEFKKSIFEHLYRDYNCTTLDTTFRMNGPICDTISSVFYNGVLKSAVGDRRVKFERNPADEELKSEHPVVVKNIVHEGTNSSEDEAEYIVDSIWKYVADCGVKPTEIAVIAPFRAQCALIRKNLRKMKDSIPDYRDIVVETVDRMQGQEREIVFISITAGGLDYMSELVNFVFNPNRFNVAISRAKSKLIMVGNIGNIRLAIPNFDSEWLQRILDSEKIFNAQ